MKRALSIILLILLSISFVGAETQEPIDISLNGQELLLDEPPIIVEGRTLVPVRFIFEPLGLTISWNSESRTAIGEKEGLSIIMPIDSTIAVVNDNPVKLDVAATIINDRTYVPLRFVAESTGAIVTWHGESRSVTIEYLDEKSIDVIFKDIYEDVNDLDGANMKVVRQQYHEIYAKVMQMKSEYLTNDEKMKEDLIELANSSGLILTSNMSLNDMLKQFKDYKINQQNIIKKDMIEKHSSYEFSNGDLYYGDFVNSEMYGLAYYQFKSGGELIGSFSNNQRQGYLSEIYESGFDYSYFDKNKEEGLEFSYSDLEDGYAYKLTYYTNGSRQGISHQVAFDESGNYLHDAYYKFKDDVSVDLEYVVYKEGFELFDRGSIDRDVVVQINPSGNIFIAPTDENGLADDIFTGFGYLKFSDGVEYIGNFDDWSRLGDGYYYAPEDKYDLQSNLMDQLANDIIEEIINDQMTDEEKVKIIHDYLANHIIYDPNPIGENDFKDISHTAYGALIDGVAVCDGYAEAYKYLLDKVNIENVLIFGESDEEGNFEGAVNHAWNLIKIDGAYSHYDLTWADDDVNNVVMYDFYKKDSTYFDETHKWSADSYIMYIE